MHRSEGSRKTFGSETSAAFIALIGGNVALAFGPLFVRLASEATIALGGFFFAADLGAWRLSILKTKLARNYLVGICIAALLSFWLK
jgi:hypothetical protein